MINDLDLPRLTLSYYMQQSYVVNHFSECFENIPGCNQNSSLETVCFWASRIRPRTRANRNKSKKQRCLAVYFRPIDSALPLVLLFLEQIVYEGREFF